MSDWIDHGRYYGKAAISCQFNSSESISKLGLWPKIEEGSIFRTQEYYAYFEDLKIEPDKEIGP